MRSTRRCSAPSTIRTAARAPGTLKETVDTPLAGRVVLVGSVSILRRGEPVVWGYIVAISVINARTGSRKTTSFGCIGDSTRCRLYHNENTGRNQDVDN